MISLDVHSWMRPGKCHAASWKSGKAYIQAFEWLTWIFYSFISNIMKCHKLKLIWMYGIVLSMTYWPFADPWWGSLGFVPSRSNDDGVMSKSFWTKIIEIYRLNLMSLQVFLIEYDFCFVSVFSHFFIIIPAVFVC